MSYIPPHKRHPKDPTRPSPVPDSLHTNLKKKINLRTSSNNCNRILYSGGYISKWFLIGPSGIEDEIPSYVKLVTVACDSVERRKGEKPLILAKKDIEKDNNIKTKESKKEEERIQLQLVAEKVVDDLVLAYEQAKKEMEEHHVLRLAVRPGKIFFYGHGAVPVAEPSRKNLNKVFSTDLPTSYLQYIKSKVVPSHAFCIDVENDTYVVKVSHYTRPNSPINCKCSVNEDGRLNMYKAELNPVRHLVVDVSCIDKNLDMRLMLASKRKITSLSEKEISNIKGILDSAIVDPNVKGGLKWPLGKTLSADGYRVFEVCHVRATTYKTGTLKLRVRESDRFNERFGKGEIKREVTLDLKDMNTRLQHAIESGCVLEMIQDALGNIWDILNCHADLT